MVSIVKMPRISMTMLDGIVMQWHKKIGDPVQEGEGLFDVETDKAVETVGSPYSGIVLSIDAVVGDIIPVDGPVCSIGTETDQAMAQGPAAHTPSPETQESAKPPLISRSAGTVRATPLAKRIAADRGIDLETLHGTGVRGMVTKADLPAAQSPPVAVFAENDKRIPFSGIRKRIADNLTKAHQSIPSVTTFAEVRMDNLKDLRRHMKISYTTFAVRASALALREFPNMNAQLEGDEIVLKEKVNVSVAISTDRGLLTPVLPGADGKNLLTLAGGLGDLSERCRAGRLASADMADGTFTVTNSGVFGAMFFTPIINPPQCAILGMGKIFTLALFDDQGTVFPAPLMMLSLTYDHRIVDGDTAVRFLQRIKHYLEHPAEMLTP